MTTNEPSAHELLVQLKHGHLVALDILYARYAGMFHGYARRYCLSREDAEDVVSNTFDRLLTCIQSYNEVICGGERWMWTICRNQVTEVLRARRKHAEELGEASLSSENTDPAWFFEQKERILALNQAWKKISEKERQEILRGRGRGPGRKEWHAAMQHLRAALSEE